MNNESEKPEKRKIQRAYVISFYQSNSGVIVMAGAEHAVHRAVVKQMLRKAGIKCKPNERLLKRLQQGQSVIDLKNSGRVAVEGPFCGRNFGGTLLIGRLALFGGRVKSTESPKDAALREFFEEAAFPMSVLSSPQLHTALLGAIEKIGEAEIGREQHHFYALNLDSVRSLDESLRHVFGNAFEKIVDDFADRVEALGRPCEKRLLVRMSPSVLLDNVGKLPDRDDEAKLREGAQEVADAFCSAIGAGDSVKVAEDLLEYQLSRTLPTHVFGVERFREWSAAGEENTPDAAN